jgi:hypothetical protein
MLLGYAPNVSRTITVATSGIAARSGIWPRRAATETTDYWLDFSRVIAAQQGDAIAAASATMVYGAQVGPPPPQIATDGSSVVVVFTGGTPGDTVTTTIIVTFVSGSTYSFVATFRIELPEIATLTPTAPYAGPALVFAIGSVTELAPASQPTASFAPSGGGTWILNLGLPTTPSEADVVTSAAISAALGGQPALLSTGGTAIAPYDASVLTVPISGTNSALGTLLAALEAEVSSIGSTVTGLSGSISSVGTSITSLSGSVSSQGGSITSLGTSLTALQGSLTTLDAGLASANTSLTTLGATVSSQGTSLTSLSASVTALETGASSQGSSVTSLGTSVTALSSSLTALQGTVSAQGIILAEQGETLTTLTALTGSVSSQGSSLTSLGSSVTALDGSLTALEGTVTSQGTSITSLGASITSLGSVITGVDGNASLAYSISLLSSSVTAQAGSLTTLDNGLTALEGTVTSQGTSITSLYGSISALPGSITALSGSLTALEGTVSSQGTSLTTLSAGLTSANTSFTALQGTVSSQGVILAEQTGSITSLNTSLTAGLAAASTANSATVGSITALASSTGSSFTSVNGSLTAIEAAANVATANTFGAVPLDATPAATLTMTLQQLVQQVGTWYPASLAANNANLGTSGLFWTANDAGAHGTVAAATLMKALITFAANQYLVSGQVIGLKFPAGLFEFGTATFTVPSFVVIAGEPGGTVFQSTMPEGSNPQWQTQGLYSGNKASDIWFHGIDFSNPTNRWNDALTGLPIATPDYASWRTLNSGYQPANNLLCSVVSSTVQLFQMGDVVVPIDTFPSAYPTLQAMQALIGKWIWNPFYGNQNAQIASITQPGGSGTPILLTITNPSQQNPGYIKRNSPGAVPARPGQPRSSSGPSLPEFAAIPAPSFDILEQYPTFYCGYYVGYFADRIRFTCCRWLNMGKGVGLQGAGDDVTLVDCSGAACAGHSESAVHRHLGGARFRWLGGYIFSSDQGAQIVPGTTWTKNGWDHFSNISITGFLFQGVTCCSSGGQALSVSSNISNNLQIEGWSTDGVTLNPVGNTVAMGPLPAKITYSDLQNSAPPYDNDAIYTAAGKTCINNNLFYTLVSNGGVPAAGGTGPTGTGSNIVDGTCVWASGAPGGGNNGQTIYLSAHQNIADNSVVIGVGVTSNGYLLTLQPPSTSATAVTTAFTAAMNISFLYGTPLNGLTNSCLGDVVGCRFICPAGSFLITVSDTTGGNHVRVSNTIFDESWDLGGTNQAKWSGNVQGGAYGDISVQFHACHWLSPYRAPINANGQISRFSMTQCRVDPMRGPSLLPPVNVTGATSGDIISNEIWCNTPANGGYAGLLLGGADGTDVLFYTVPGSSWGLRVRDNDFLGIPDYGAGLQCSYGGRHMISGNKFAQQSVVGQGASPGAAGIFWDRYVEASSNAGENDFTGIQGQAYLVAGQNTAPPNLRGWDFFNSSAGTQSASVAQAVFDILADPLPTSSTGLAELQWWNDNGTITQILGGGGSSGYAGLDVGSGVPLAADAAGDFYLATNGSSGGGGGGTQSLLGLDTGGGAPLATDGAGDSFLSST